MVYKNKDGKELPSFYQEQRVTYFYDEERKLWEAFYEVGQANWDEEKNAWGTPLKARIGIETANFEEAMYSLLEHYTTYMEDIGWNLENEVEDSPYLIKDI